MELEEPKRVLHEFIVAMNIWEVKYWKMISEKGRVSVKEEMARDLTAIFDKYCSKRKRKTGRQTSLTCQNPPEYAPDEEVIGAYFDNGAAIIETRQHSGISSRFRYTLQFKNSEWRVDRKERYSSYEKKWVKYNL